MKKIALLTAVATLTACSSNDVPDAFAGLRLTTQPAGASVYVGRQRIGVTPLNVPDSAWERPGGRVSDTGVLRVVAPGCELSTVPVDLSRTLRDLEVEMTCEGDERYQPSDLGFLENRGVLDLVSGIDRRAGETDLERIRRDELHVIHAEGRLTDSEFRSLIK